MISQDQYKKFLEAVIDHIEGDWVLVGGALIAVLIPNARVTVDIDLCPVGELTNERRIQLMKLAQASDLSIEAINPSADFFLRQIPHWQSSLVPFLKGHAGTLFRPSLHLYIQMKCERATESDISDCLLFIDWHRSNNISLETEKPLLLLSQKISREASAKKIDGFKLIAKKLSAT